MSVTLHTEGDTIIVVKRRFAAPPEALYRAHTEPRYVSATSARTVNSATSGRMPSAPAST
jgi:hypothetical protein